MTLARALRRGLAAIVLLVPISGLAGELYRWVDEEGKVHFGDRPPHQAEAEAISAKLDPINRADATATTKPAGVHQASLQHDYDKKQRQQQLQREQQHRRACAQARRQLRILQGPVALVDARGREIRMSEREREQRAAQLKREVARRCG